MDVMVLPTQASYELGESALEFKTIVSLNEIGFEWKNGQHPLQSSNGATLIQKRQYDALLESRVDVHDRIQEAGVRQTRQLGCHIFNIHLQFSGHSCVSGMHMRGRLIARPAIRDPFLD